MAVTLLFNEKEYLQCHFWSIHEIMYSPEYSHYLRVLKMIYHVGDEVAWRSQASGFLSEKRGTIVYVIPRNQWIKDVIDPNWARNEFTLCTDFAGHPRDHESYLVAVPGKTPHAKRKLYWPRVSQLKKIDC